METSIVRKQTPSLQVKHEAYIRGMGSYFSPIWQGGDHDRVPFYPLWFNQYLNRKLPVIVDMNNLMLVYSSIPALRTIFDKKSELLKNGRLRLFKRSNKPQVDDEEVFNHPFLNLWKRVNCLPGGTKAFIEQWCLMFELYGTALVRKIKPSTKSYPMDLKCLPMGEMMIRPTGYLFDETQFDNIIEVYRWMNAQNPQGGIVDFEDDEVIAFVNGQTDRYFFGIPKIVTNKLAVSNLQLSMQTSNVIMADRGAQGILSNESTDASGSIPIDEKERRRIERDYRNEYGLDEGQGKIILTNARLKWQPMTFPRKDLMLDEIYEQAFSICCDMLGLQRGLFAETVASKAKETIGGDGKGKIEEALKITYETTIRELAEVLCDAFTYDKDFQLDEQGIYAKMTYDHLPVMQEDEVDAEKVNSQKMTTASVASTSILAINNDVKTGSLDYEAAIQILISIFGIDEQIAREIILKPKEIATPETTEPPKEETDEEKAYKKQLNKFKL